MPFPATVKLMELLVHDNVDVPVLLIMPAVGAFVLLLIVMLDVAVQPFASVTVTV